MLILLLLACLHFSTHFYPTRKECERISQKIIWKMKSCSVCKKRYYAGEPFNPAYRTVPRLNNTVPYRLALLVFFLYRLVPRRYGTVRYGIDTAYRQSLIYLSEYSEFSCKI